MYVCCAVIVSEKNIQGCSGAYDPTRWPGQELFKISQTGSGRVNKCSNSHGSDQEVSEISLVGSGRVDPTYQFFAGRVGNDPTSQFLLLGSGQVMTHERRVTHGSGQNNTRVFLC